MTFFKTYCWIRDWSSSQHDRQREGRQDDARCQEGAGFFERRRGVRVVLHSPRDQRRDRCQQVEYDDEERIPIAKTQNGKSKS